MKKHLSLLILLGCMFTGSRLFSQTLTYEWARQGSGSYVEQINGVATDAAGNVIVTGTFYSDTLTLGSFTLINPDTFNRGVLFLAKYSPSGNILWATTAKTLSYGESVEGSAVATDGSNNIYVSGDLWGDTIVIQNDTIGLPMPYSNAGFIAKFDPSGTFVWCRMAYAGRGTQSVTVDDNGDVYFTGIAALAFQGTITAPVGGIYLAKYSNAGNFIWASVTQHTAGTLGFTNEWMVNDVCTDSADNVYITGWSGSDTTYFNASKTVYVVNNASLRNLFLVKYDHDGNALWASSASRGITPGITTSVSGKSIATSGNNIYLTGHFSGDTLRFGSHPLQNIFVYQDIFLAKFDLSGNPIWAQSTGTSSNDNGNGVAIDGSGFVYITGSFEGDVIHYNSNPLDTIEGGNKAMVVQFDASGNLIEFVRPLNILPYGVSFGNDIAIDPDDNIYTGGYFYGEVGFGVDTIQGTGIWNDPFVAKMFHSVTSLESFTQDGNLQLYPNPASDAITVDLSGQTFTSAEIRIYDMMGREMISETVHTGNATLNLQSLPQGTYVVRVNAGNKVYTGKIIVQ